jgi:hypothetical protein
MNWINIKDRLPKHEQTVLAKSNKGYCVVIFINSIDMNKQLLKNGYGNECVNTDKHPFYFLSQEIKRHTLNDVTHWMELSE